MVKWYEDKFCNLWITLGAQEHQQGIVEPKRLST